MGKVNEGEFGRAMAAQAAGEVKAAEAIYRKLFAKSPKDARLSGALGAALLQQGMLDEAEKFIETSRKLDPNHPDTNHNAGRLRLHRGDPKGALTAFAQALRHRPGFALAHAGVGLAHHALGQHDEAAAAFLAALENEPRLLEALFGLAQTRRAQGRLQEAALRLRHAITQAPAHAGAYADLGFIVKGLGHKERGLALLHRADSLQPDSPLIVCNIGLAKLDMDDVVGAEHDLQRSLDLGWNVGAAIGLAQVKERGGDFVAADGIIQNAIARAPHSPEALVHASFVAEHLGRRDQARSLLDRCITLAPKMAQAQLNLSLLLLNDGEFARAWPLYEARRHIDDKQRVTTFGWALPEWDGAPLSGKRVLFAREQGLGDQIQYLRYAAVLAEEAARVDVLVDPALAELAATAPGVSAVLTDPNIDVASYDVWTLMMSTPLHRGERFDLSRSGYLRPTSASIAHWRERIAQAANGKRSVGIVWAGNKSHVNDRNRSIPFEMLRAFAALSGVQFFSFQKGEEAIQDRAQAIGLELFDLGASFASFTDTAAACLAVDLVISVDTSVAHIAGAVGAPTWLLLPANNDWRWMRDREDSPWYPNIRLIRQSGLGEWPATLERVAGELAEWKNLDMIG